MDTNALEAKLKRVTEQRDRAWGKINWFLNSLNQTRLSRKQQEFKTQLELEISLDLYQADFELAQQISQEEQDIKLVTFPLRGQLIG